MQKSAHKDLDLAIIGGGSGGLIAADFAARLDARVAIIEAKKIGGDCTWTGCVPSKALVKVARVAHQIRCADRFGIAASEPQVDMAGVRDSIRSAVERVYRAETPETLELRGIGVVKGSARFIDPTTIAVDGRTIRARKFIIATGARPATPAIVGLDTVPYATYETIFENDRLPEHFVMIGGGPVGAEVAQAYRRLGSGVTLIAPRLLPREDEETRLAIQRVFEREQIHCHYGRAESVRMDGSKILITTGADEEIRGDFLMVATGRRPNLASLDLDAAGVVHAEGGIPIDRHMRTNVRHIHAVGDVDGGPQFTHFAGWQGFHAARSALLPGGGGETDLVPRVTFTDPEVAHVGPNLQTCRELYGDGVESRRMEVADLDRAAADQESDGFIRLIVRPNGQIVAATVVAPHAGETLGELVVAIKNRVHAGALADTMHAYPSYASGLQQLAVDLSLDRSLSGFTGRLARWFAGGRVTGAGEFQPSPVLQPSETEPNESR